MLVGQELGPFKIDKELGSGAMGSVFRGVYSKTGQKVAIKIMAPGLAANEQSIRRFEREANILKDLNHPHIVRFFGTGKDSKTRSRYYVMEYVEGEALDRVMARRGRMTWEEIVALGLQLCSALQHAHDKGVVHRDLKPSNVMVLRDGTLKLTDFGIAKDLDAEELTGTNCTVGTAAYMSPEQCKGERNLSHKSDLYSLGVLFYELVTGKKPFVAENAMDMFLLHVQGAFERPSRLVLDIPVWLDNLICQLLEKNPDHRPFDADTVANALSSIQEKVEAQQSAGVDVARKRRIDRLNHQPKPIDETDREAARTLVGKKTRKKKLAFYRTGWFVGLCVVALLAGLGVLLAVLLGPPSPDKLYAEAEKLVKSKDPNNWEKALDGPIKLYHDNYANRPGPQTEQIETWEKEIRVKQNESKLLSYLSKKNSPIAFQAQNDAEKAAFKGIDAEEEGDLKRAREIWESMVKDFGAGSGYTSWGQLAEAHLKLFDSVQSTEKMFRVQYENLLKLGQDPKVGSADEKEAFLAFWYEWFGDPFMAQRRFEDLSKKTRKYLSDSSTEIEERFVIFVGPQRLWRVLAAGKNRELTEVLKRNPDAEKGRTEMVKKKLEEAKQARREQKEGLCLSIWTLYQGEKAMEPFVKEAQDILSKLPKR